MEASASRGDHGRNRQKKLRWDSVGVPAEIKRPRNYPLSTDNRYYQASEEEKPLKNLGLRGLFS